MLHLTQVDVAFDQAELRTRCLDNQALMFRVIEAFLASGAETLSEIEHAAITRQWPKLARAAHRLKGASANVAAHHLQHLAIRIGELTELEPNDFTGPVAALRDEWKQFEKHARAFLELADPTETGSPSSP